MRTLATQMMLRRLVTVHAGYLERISADPASTELPEAARARLLELVGAVRRAWERELAAAAMRGDASDQEFLQRHVRRSLSAMEAAAAAVGTRWVEPSRLQREFSEVAVPLGFFLRGLESTAAPARLPAALSA